MRVCIDCLDNVGMELRWGMANLLGLCFTMKTVEEHLAKIESMEGAVWVEVRGEVVGVGLLENVSDVLDMPIPAVYLLQSFCVHFEFRGHGLGGQMLHRLWVKKIWVGLHVDVGDTHECLVAWYTKRGFRVVKAARKIELNPAVETLMVSNLVPPCVTRFCF